MSHWYCCLFIGDQLPADHIPTLAHRLRHFFGTQCELAFTMIPLVPWGISRISPCGYARACAFVFVPVCHKESGIDWLKCQNRPNLHTIFGTPAFLKTERWIWNHIETNVLPMYSNMQPGMGCMMVAQMGDLKLSFFECNTELLQVERSVWLSRLDLKSMTSVQFCTANEDMESYHWKTHHLGVIVCAFLSPRKPRHWTLPTRDTVVIISTQNHCPNLPRTTRGTWLLILM